MGFFHFYLSDFGNFVIFRVVFFLASVLVFLSIFLSVSLSLFPFFFPFFRGLSPGSVEQIFEIPIIREVVPRTVCRIEILLSACPRIRLSLPFLVLLFTSTFYVHFLPSSYDFRLFSRPSFFSSFAFFFSKNKSLFLSGTAEIPLFLFFCLFLFVKKIYLFSCFSFLFTLVSPPFRPLAR